MKHTVFELIATGPIQSTKRRVSRYALSVSGALALLQRQYPCDDGYDNWEACKIAVFTDGILARMKAGSLYGFPAARSVYSPKARGWLVELNPGAKCEHQYMPESWQ